MSSRTSRRRRVLVERLESRQLLAGDVGTGELGFAQSLPTASELNIGETVTTSDGREVCLAFQSTPAAAGSAPAGAEGEQFAPGPVDLTAAIVQQPGPLGQGDPFTAEITFENQGVGDATASNLVVTFDANLTNVTWEREIIRTQGATVATEDLDGTLGFSLPGLASTDQTGFSVSGSGDFNDDGIDDLIVGAVQPNGTDAGRTYVVFGNESGFPAQFDLATLDGTNGFVLEGVSPGSAAGESVDNAGDVNGDGIDDIIVGASVASPGTPARVNAGEAYVFFGSDSGFSASIDLSLLDGNNGFRIPGLVANGLLGTSVGGAGDVNNDGLGDIIVGAPGVTNGGDVVGSGYVIYGSLTPFGATFDLSLLNGSNGFAVTSVNAGDELGISVDGAGDVNDDGLDDIIVGATQSTSAGGDGSGAVVVIYGDAGPVSASIDIGSLLVGQGFTIDGPRAGHSLGADVAGVGDVNDDGVDDFLFTDEVVPGTASARSYLIFGDAGGFPVSLDISSLDGTTGFAIDAPVSNHPNPMAVSNLGDVNGDNINDFVIGLAATSVTPPGAPTPTDIPGGAFVVYGSGAGFSSPLDLGSLDGDNGFLIAGDIIEQAGRSVGAAGDINNDGLNDIILGAPFANLLAGESYVVYGRGVTVDNGVGAIDETFDLFEGDQVIYRVSANIAPGGTVETVVNASATPGPGINDTDLNNNSAMATTTITSDVTPPTVLDVLVAGVGGAAPWQTAFIDAIDDTGPLGADNGLGFSTDGVTRPLPWYTIDTIYIRYSEPVTAPSGLSLTGIAVADYAGDFNVAHAGDLTTITMTSPFGLPENDFGLPTSGIDRLLLEIAAGGVTDLSGNSLAAAFDRQFDVLPGDGNGSGNVSNADVGLTNLRGFTTPGGGPNTIGFTYDAFYDVNASANISAADVGLTNLQGFDELPAIPPSPPAPASGLSAAGSGESEGLDEWERLVDQALAESLF